MAVNVGNLEATLGLNSASFVRGVNTASSKLDRFGSAAIATGRTLTRSLSLPLLAVGGLSLKAASDFESSFTGVRKTVDATEKEFKTLEKQLRRLAKTMPVNVNELNKIAESAGQLGIKKKNIIAFTKTIAKLGVTTNLSSEEAATSMARFANITQLPQEEIGNLASVIVDLGNNLATTEKEILEMGLRLAGSGKQVGLTESDILGLSGALSSVGIRAEAGGTAFSRVMSDIAMASAKGGDEIAGFAKVADQSAADFAKSFKETPAKAMKDFIKGIARVGAEGKDTFGVLEDLDLGNIRVRDSLLRLAGANGLLDDSMKISSEAFVENTALGKEAQKRFETFESKTQLLKSALNDMAIDIGNQLIPIFLDLFKEVKPLLAKFKALTPATQKNIVKLGLLLIAIGPVITIIGKLAKATRGLSKAMTFLHKHPILLVIAAMVLLFEAGTKVKDLFNDGMNPALKNMQAPVASLLGPLGLLGDAWSSMGDRVADVIANYQKVARLIRDILGLTPKLGKQGNKLAPFIAPSNFFGGASEVQGPGIPRLAEGGIITKATQAIIGESGPEAVIPLDKLDGMGGTTFQIENINVNVPDGRVDTFMSELNRQTRSANLKRRVTNG